VLNFRKLVTSEMEFEGLRFEVERVARKRGISLTLRPNGRGKIRAGLGCPDREIARFLSEKQKWIRSVSERFRELRQKYPPFVIRDGAEIPLLGDACRVRLERSSHRRISLRLVERNFILEVPETLADPETPEVQEKLRHILRKHYQNMARKLLPKRAEFWARQTGLEPRKILLRAPKTRWGSCSPSGSISLNWKLICAKPATIDYVIVHELCHLRHLNHSRNFWNLVEAHCPAWREEKKWLQSRSFEFDFLNKSSELHI
jgi:predicted metal-dependent hydrolase